MVGSPRASIHSTCGKPRPCSTSWRDEKGGCLTAARQNSQQLDVFFVGNDGAITVTWVVGIGHWSDGSPGNHSPARITRPGTAKPGSCVAVAKLAENELDAFVVGNDGSLWLTWETDDGHSSDGTPGNAAPWSLSQALFMHNWFYWPHIHGAPVYAEFNGGRKALYVWPEKDHLKSFPWLGDRADVDHRVLAVGRNGQLLAAPPGPPAGMPGGMLGLTVDAGQRDAGVLFASIPNQPDQAKGVLHAFDPISLRQLWNNVGEDYHFAKFVPPTLAGNRVFLPTASPSNEVIVYGVRPSARGLRLLAPVLLAEQMRQAEAAQGQFRST
jgi:hypothetical protein